jgi:hypothetical protein
MLKAHWSGFEIDSSEAAYEVKVPQPEELGTLVRGLLGSGYFVRSYYLLFEEPMVRLRDFILQRGDQEERLGAKALDYLEKQIGRFKPDRASTIGVRAIEAILNYVGVRRKELFDAGTFRFELTEEEREMYEDYDYEFEPGQRVDETDFYSEGEIPLDGVVLYLGCSLVKLSKLSPEEQKRTYRRTKQRYKEVGLLEEMAAWGFGRPRDYVLEDLDRPQPLTLRVRLNPDATFTITGRWFDDGQFIYPHYEFLLKRAAKKAGAKIGFHMIY